MKRETEYCQNPRGDGGANVGPHDDADTGKDLREGVGSHGGEDAAHAITCHFLEAVGEQVQTEQEKCDGS